MKLKTWYGSIRTPSRFVTRLKAAFNPREGNAIIHSLENGWTRRSPLFLKAPVVFVVEPAVDLRDLRDPLLPLTVFEPEDLLVRPVKVIRDVRYLLVEPL